jgi:hypothetical protein
MDGIRDVVASLKPFPRLEHDGVRAAITRSSEVFEVDYCQASISPVQQDWCWLATNAAPLPSSLLLTSRSIVFPETHAEYADLTVVLSSLALPPKRRLLDNRLSRSLITSLYCTRHAAAKKTIA